MSGKEVTPSTLFESKTECKACGKNVNLVKRADWFMSWPGKVPVKCPHCQKVITVAFELK